MTDFREGGLFAPPPIPWAAPKKPILNRVNANLKITCFISVIEAFRVYFLLFKSFTESTFKVIHFIIDHFITVFVLDVVVILLVIFVLSPIP